jgi:competence ComEA-like helix-hairpin-helix protein
MGLYTRQQLALLLLLVGAAGGGLAVSDWRAAHPELVARLEEIDRASPAASSDVVEERIERVTAPRAPAPRAGADRPPRTPASPRAPKRAAPPDDIQRTPLDLNHATLDDLTRLPGVGPVLAQRILETREAGGRFTTVDDLAGVRGLGRSKLERLRPFVGVSE